MFIETQKTFRKDTLRLIFSGDYMQHIPQVKGARISETEYDYLSTMSLVKPFFEKADYVIMNLETTLSHDDFSGFPLFRSPKACVEQLRESGVNVLALANNHCCDNGEKGVGFTLGVSDSCGFFSTGVYADSASFFKRHPLVLSKGDLRVALLNYTQHTNGLPVPQGIVVNKIDTVRILEDIRRVKSQGVDNIIVFYHWGEEYAQKPNAFQEKLASWTHRNGVVLVVGSHPHVIQPLALSECDSLRQLTFYSLGNFISNQPEFSCKGGASLWVELVSGDNDSPAFLHDAAYMLHWVSSEWEGGRRRFRVIPSFVADTLLRGSCQFADYKLFVEQSRLVLSESCFVREVSDY
ncbi:MAG: CapA family protein [Bacteroidales bacterium]